MRVNWRTITAARNTYAVLFAACEQGGYHLRPVERPEDDITCYSLNSLNEPLLRNEIRDACCTTVVGGPHATACYRQVVRYADYVVVGEGEHTLPALLASIEAGDRRPVPGVATREGYEPVRSSVRLDAYPAFSTIKGYTEISRGCPHHCGYCQTPCIFGGTMRHRSVDAVVRAASQYQDVRLVSPNAFAYGSEGRSPRWDRVRHLLSRLSGKIYFGTFPSEVRPEFVSAEGLALVDRYCANDRIHFGAQSGSDRVLEQLHRGHTVADVVAAVETCRDAGFTPVVDLILGLPFETDEDQRSSVQLIQWVVRTGHVHAHLFIPLPGTPLGRCAPRSLLSETQTVLGRLALAGRVTGSWRLPSG